VAGKRIMLSSLDTRIAAAAPNAGYIGLADRADYPQDRGDLEQNPADLLSIGDYTHLIAMLASRPALLIYNEHDDRCFASPRARLSVFQPVIPFYQLLNKADEFQYYDNLVPGTHNYDLDNREQFYKFIDRCFLPTPTSQSLGQRDAHGVNDKLFEACEISGLTQFVRKFSFYSW